MARKYKLKSKRKKYILADLKKLEETKEQETVVKDKVNNSGILEITKNKVINEIIKRQRKNINMTIYYGHGRLDVPAALVNDIYNEFEKVIFDNLQKANNEQKVLIKIFNGLSLNCEYHESYMKKLNYKDETIEVGERIVAKSNITRAYNNKLNANRIKNLKIDK